MSISLGSISFSLSADTRDLDAAIKRVQAFGTQVSNAARRTGDGARAHEAQLRRQEAASIKALQSVQKFQDAVGRAGAAGSKNFINTTGSLNKLVKELTSGALKPLEFQRAMERFGVEIGNANRQLVSYKNNQMEAAKAQREAAKASAQQEARLLAQSRLVFTMEQQYAKLAAQVKRSGANPDILNTPRAALSQAQSTLGGGAVMPNRARAAEVQSFTAAINTARIALGEFHRPPKDPGWLSRALDQSAQSAVLLAGPLSGVATRLQVLSNMASSINYGMVAFAAGASAAAYGFFKLSQAVIDSARKMEKAQLGLQAISGSAVLARQDLAWVMEVAMKTGGRFDILAQEFSKMSAAAKGTNLEGQRTRDIFQSIAFASATLGLSQEDTAGTMRALQQIMSKGKVSAEELRQQLGDRLPIAVQAMAAGLGVTTAELDKLMKKGQVTSDALVKFSEEVIKRLGIDTTKAIDNVVSAEGRLYNSVQKLLQAIDQQTGISTAYKNVLNSLSSVLTKIAGDLQSIVIPALALTSGAMLALFGPAIYRGIVALPPAIAAVTTAVMTLNIAVAANPMTAWLGVILRVGAAIGGTVAAYYTLKNALDNSSGAFNAGRSTVQEYIRSQENTKVAIRSTTQEIIKQAEALATMASQRVSNQQALISGLESSFGGSAPSSMDLGVRGAGPIARAAFREGQTRLTQARQDLLKLQEEAQKAQTDIQALQKILDKPERLPVGTGFGDPEEKSKSMVRLEVARKNALDTIRETQQAYNNLFLDPAAKAWAEIQLEVNKKIEDFRDRLTSAKVPAAEITDLTKKYGDALRSLKEAEYTIKQHPGIWKTLADVMGRGFDKALDSFVDGIMEGKSALEVFQNVAKEVVKDILKTFMQLSVMNPLKNLLFGQGLPTIGNNSLGVGGLLGKLVGGFMGTPGAATGRKVNPGRAYTVGEKGKELFVPDGAGEIIPNHEMGNLRKLMTTPTTGSAQGVGGNVYVQVINEDGGRTKVTTQEERKGNDKFIKIMVSQMIASGEFDNSMAARYGTRPRRTG